MKEHQIEESLITVITVQNDCVDLIMQSLLNSDILTKETSYELLKTNPYFDQSLLAQLP